MNLFGILLFDTCSKAVLIKISHLLQYYLGNIPSCQKWRVVGAGLQFVPKLLIVKNNRSWFELMLQLETSYKELLNSGQMESQEKQGVS